MKYRQIDANEALELCKAGTTVLAARYVDGMTFREVSAAAVLLAVELPKPAEVAPEPVTPEPCATSHTDKPDNPVKPPEKPKPDAKPRQPQDVPPKPAITARKVAEMKLSGAKRAEMARYFGVTPKQMTAWMYNHKATLEKEMESLKCGKTEELEAAPEETAGEAASEEMLKDIHELYEAIKD